MQAAQLSPWAKRAAPILGAVKTLTIVAGPHVTRLCEVAAAGWKQLEPYHPEELLPAMFGLMLCFFGGAFVTTISAPRTLSIICGCCTCIREVPKGAGVTIACAAAFEAFRVVAYDQVKDALCTLWQQYRAAVAAAEKDAPPRAAEDNTAKFQRQLATALKACDPDVVHDALVATQAGIMSVVANLRIKFAQTLTFGVSMGAQLNEVLGCNSNQGFVNKQLSIAIPPEYQKCGSRVCGHVSELGCAGQVDPFHPQLHLQIHRNCPRVDGPAGKQPTHSTHLTRETSPMTRYVALYMRP